MKEHCIGWEPVGTPSVRSVGLEVGEIITNVLGKHLYASLWERGMRLLEEAMELAQALGIEKENARALETRVWSRPPGDPNKEAAGVFVTLAVLARSAGIDLETEIRTEVARVRAMDPQVFRARQRNKVPLGLAPFDDEPVPTEDTAYGSVVRP